MEGQFAGQTIKGRVRNRDGRGIVWQNEEQIWEMVEEERKIE